MPANSISLYTDSRYDELNDGEKRNVNLADLIKPPVFIKLQIVEEFNKVKINPVGGICWDCGADLSAEYLKVA